MLVTKRGQLKGLSHKQELAQTKEDIMVSHSFKNSISNFETPFDQFGLESIKRAKGLNSEALPSIAGQPRCRRKPETDKDLQNGTDKHDAGTDGGAGREPAVRKVQRGSGERLRKVTRV